MLKKVNIIQWLLITILFITTITIATLLFVYYSGLELLALSGIFWGLLLVFLLFLASLYSLVKRLNFKIKKSYKYYLENLISHKGIGIILFDEYENIIWLSGFLINRGFENYMGKKINFLDKEIYQLVSTNKKNLIIIKDGVKYMLEMFYEKKTILVSDVTTEINSKEFHNNERIILGELDVDNFTQLQPTLSSDDIFKIIKIIIEELDAISKKNQFVYRQYTSSKFFIIMNYETLSKLRESNFDFIDRIRSRIKEKNNIVTVSVGIGIDSTIFSELQDMAKEGISISQSRGGDQVTIISKIKNNEYIGGNTEGRPFRAILKSKALSKEISNRLENEDIDRVIIHGHTNSDLDAIGAALGLYQIIKTFNIECYIANINYDSSTLSALKRLFNPTEMKKMFIGPTKALTSTTNNTISIVVDTNKEYLIDAIKALNKTLSKNVYIFDHHRRSEILFPHVEDNIYIDTTASSTSEIITILSLHMTRKINFKQPIAQMLLNGIYLDTSNFSKSTTDSTFLAASILKRQGAIPIEAINSLKPTEEQAKLIRKILTYEYEVKPGIFLAAYDGEADDITISMAANAMLNISDRLATFVIARLSKTKFYKMSARSTNLNVQLITEQLGGGGHFHSAATINEDFATFKDNVIQAIMSVDYESNIN